MRFAEEGAKIFAVDLKSDTMVETLERVKAVAGEVEPSLCDVTDRKAVEVMVAACVDRSFWHRWHPRQQFQHAYSVFSQLSQAFRDTTNHSRHPKGIVVPGTPPTLGEFILPD